MPATLPEKGARAVTAGQRQERLPLTRLCMQPRIGSPPHRRTQNSNPALPNEQQASLGLGNMLCGAELRVEFRFLLLELRPDLLDPLIEVSKPRLRPSANRRCLVLAQRPQWCAVET